MPLRSIRSPVVVLVLCGCGSDDVAATGEDGGSGSGSTGPTASGSTGGTAGGTAGETELADVTSADSSSGASPKFDLPQPDGGSGCGGGGALEFSNIWIANSLEGTVSKIDTLTRVEVARYVTGPAGQRDPSRTSVDLDGDMAVVNREGSVSKIVARLSDCVDQDGDGAITTSTGPADVLPWGGDECVAWNVPLPVRARPVAWTSGVSTECDGHVDEKLWVSAPMGDDATVWLLDGATGAIEGEVVIPDIAPADFDPVYHGIYGAAVDGANDFWGSVKSVEPLLVHVRIDDMSVEVIEIPLASSYPSYGMTIGADGNLWVGGQGAVQRYDPVAEAWATVAGVIPEAWYRGMMVDASGALWVAVVDQSGGIAGSSSGLARIDPDGLFVAEYITSFGGQTMQEATGVSIDVDGFVWVVDQFSDGVFIHDPTGDTPSDFVGGLVGPYTYSDMTGWALSQVATPEG